MECTQPLEECTQPMISDSEAQQINSEQVGFLGMCGMRYPLFFGSNKIGRSPDECKIVIDKESLSRIHAEIFVEYGKKFILRDLKSTCKTKLGLKTLTPYEAYHLNQGDTIQFGKIFATFGLLEVDSDLPMTQDIELPETPVSHQFITKLGHNAPFTTIPESPDVSDKDESFIASTQHTPGPHFKNPQSHFIKPSNNLIIKPVIGGNKIDNVYWNSLKNSPSCKMFNDSDTLNNSPTSINSPNTVVNNNLTKCNDIYEMETQEVPHESNELIDSIYTKDTQLASITNFTSEHSFVDSIQTAENGPATQINEQKLGFQFEYSTLSPNKKNDSIHSAETQLNFGLSDKSIHELDTQEFAGNELTNIHFLETQAFTKEGIHNANSQIVPSTSTSHQKEKSIKTASLKTNDKIADDVSENLPVSQNTQEFSRNEVTDIHFLETQAFVEESILNANSQIIPGTSTSLVKDNSIETALLKINDKITDNESENSPVSQNTQEFARNEVTDIHFLETQACVGDDKHNANTQIIPSVTSTFLVRENSFKTVSLKVDDAIRNHVSENLPVSENTVKSKKIMSESDEEIFFEEVDEQIFDNLDSQPLLPEESSTDIEMEKKENITPTNIHETYSELNLVKNRKKTCSLTDNLELSQEDNTDENISDAEDIFSDDKEPIEGESANYNPSFHNLQKESGEDDSTQIIEDATVMEFSKSDDNYLGCDEMSTQIIETDQLDSKSLKLDKLEVSFDEMSNQIMEDISDTPNVNTKETAIEDMPTQYLRKDIKETKITLPNLKIEEMVDNIDSNTILQKKSVKNEETLQSVTTEVTKSPFKIPKLSKKTTRKIEPLRLTFVKHNNILPCKTSDDKEAPSTSTPKSSFNNDVTREDNKDLNHQKQCYSKESVQVLNKTPISAAKEDDIDINFFNATQDITSDTHNERYLSPVLFNKVMNKDDIVSSPLEELGYGDNFRHIDAEILVADLPAKHSKLCDGSEDKINKCVTQLCKAGKQSSSDLSDFEETPKKEKHLNILEIELPNSQDIKSIVSGRILAHTESSSDSDTETQNSEEQNTPVLFRMKAKSKTSAVKMNLTKIFDVDTLPSRFSTRRKPIAKVNNCVEKEEIKQEDNIDRDIITENITRLKNEHKKLSPKSSKSPNQVDYNPITDLSGQSKNDLVKGDKPEDTCKSSKTRSKRKPTDKSIKERKKSTDVNKSTKHNSGTTNDIRKYFRETSNVINSSRTTRGSKTKSGNEIEIKTTKNSEKEEIKPRILSKIRNSPDKKGEISHALIQGMATRSKLSKSLEIVEGSTSASKRKQSPAVVLNSKIKRQRNSRSKKSTDLQNIVSQAVVDNENKSKRQTKSRPKKSADLHNNSNETSLSPKRTKKQFSIEQQNEYSQEVVFTGRSYKKPSNPIDIETKQRESSPIIIPEETQVLTGKRSRKPTNTLILSLDTKKRENSPKINQGEIQKGSCITRSKNETNATNAIKLNPLKDTDDSTNRRSAVKNLRKTRILATSSIVISSDSSPAESPKGKKRSAKFSEDDHTESRPKRIRTSENNSVRSLRCTPARAAKTQFVLCTAFPVAEAKDNLEKLGASIVTDLKACTVVLTAQIKRTCKLLCAVGLGKPIVDRQWMQACVDTKTLADPWLYLIKDKSAEERYQFSLPLTLVGKRQFLKGYSLSCTPKVLPGEDELKLIVECSGGKWHAGGARWLCVSCVADKHLWPALKGQGAIVVNTELVLGGALQQKLDIKANTLLK